MDLDKEIQEGLIQQMKEQEDLESTILLDLSQELETDLARVRLRKRDLLSELTSIRAHESVLEMKIQTVSRMRGLAR